MSLYRAQPMKKQDPIALVQQLTQSFISVTTLCQQFLNRKSKASKGQQKPSSLPKENEPKPPRTIHISKSANQKKLEENQTKGYVNFNDYKGNVRRESNGEAQDDVIEVEGSQGGEDSRQKVAVQRALLTNPPKPRNAIVPTNPPKPMQPPPKSPISPYFSFYKSKKGLIKQQNPEMSVSEIATAAAKVWKELTDEEKQPFNEMFLQEQQAYQKQMAEYIKRYPNYKETVKKMGLK